MICRNCNKDKQGKGLYCDDCRARMPDEKELTNHNTTVWNEKLDGRLPTPPYSSIQSDRLEKKESKLVGGAISNPSHLDSLKYARSKSQSNGRVKLGKIEGKIYSLLCAGELVKNIAKQMNKSYRSVYKKAKKYERDGLIEPESKYPLIFRAKKEILPPDMSSTQKQLLIPHRFGATFAVFGKAKVEFDKTGYKTIKEIDHTFRLGKNKAVLWLKTFAGSTPKEIQKNAKAHFEELANRYSVQFAIRLTKMRILSDIEWVLGDKPASSEMNEICDIKPYKTIAGAQFKFSDATHPDYIEINRAKGYAPEIPTQHASTLHWVLTTLPDQFKTVAEQLSMQVALSKENVEFNAQYAKNIAAHLKVLAEMSETLKEIRKELRK